MLKFHNHNITTHDGIIHFVWVHDVRKKRYVELCLRRNTENVPYVLHTYYNEDKYHADEIRDYPYRMKCGYPKNAEQIVAMFNEYEKRTYKPTAFFLTPEMVTEWLENPQYVGQGTYKPENLDYTEIEEYYQK